MRPALGPSVTLSLGIALIGLCLLWLGPRPVYELWVAEELEGGQAVRVPVLEPGRPAADSAPLPRLVVVDLDSDGDDDLLHYEDGRLAYYRNDGADGLTARPASNTTLQEAIDSGAVAQTRGRRWEQVQDASRPEWARRGLFFDADNDGDLDIVLAEREGEAEGVTLRFHMRLESGYREIGARLGPAWTKRRELREFVCGDFNGDGLLDLALAPPEGPPVILWNRFARR